MTIQPQQKRGYTQEKFVLNISDNPPPPPPPLSPMRLHYLTTLGVEISCNYVPHFIGIWRNLLLLMPDFEIKLRYLDILHGI